MNPLSASLIAFKALVLNSSVNGFIGILFILMTFLMWSAYTGHRDRAKFRKQALRRLNRR